jgi:hypothetical protein
MNLFPSMKGVQDDPTFLVLGGLSVLVVLVALYLGGWKYITGTALLAVYLVLGLVTLLTGFFAVVEFIAVLAAPPDRRGVHLTWGFIMTASTLLNHVYSRLITSASTPVGRFLQKLQ